MTPKRSMVIKFAPTPRIQAPSIASLDGTYRLRNTTTINKKSGRTEYNSSLGATAACSVSATTVNIAKVSQRMPLTAPALSARLRRAGPAFDPHRRYRESLAPPKPAREDLRIRSRVPPAPAARPRVRWPPTPRRQVAVSEAPAPRRDPVGRCAWVDRVARPATRVR